MGAMDNTYYLILVFVIAVLIILYIMRRHVRLGKRTPKFWLWVGS